MSDISRFSDMSSLIRPLAGGIQRREAEYIYIDIEGRIRTHNDEEVARSIRSSSGLEVPNQPDMLVGGVINSSSNDIVPIDLNTRN